MVHKLRKARKKREWLLRVLGREGTYDRTSGIFYVALAQAILMYRSETWFMYPCIGSMLGRFHHRVVQRLMGKQTSRRTDGTWVYPLLEEAMVEVGLQEVETYVACRHNTVAQYIATRTIMDLCMAAEWRPGKRV